MTDRIVKNRTFSLMQSTTGNFGIAVEGDDFPKFERWGSGVEHQYLDAVAAAVKIIFQDTLKDRLEPAVPKDLGTTTGTGGYLDKAKTLHSLKCLVSVLALNGSPAYHTARKITGEIERGEFDAKLPPVFVDAFQSGIDTAKKALAKKDAEIAELNEEIEKQNYIIDKQDRQATEFERGAKKRILDLEKALQEAKKPQTTNICGKCRGIGCINEYRNEGNTGGISSSVCPDCKGTGMKLEPPKDEPELVICDHAEERCKGTCNAWRPHEKSSQCTFDHCDIHPDSKCIPVKKEPTVPQQPVPLPNTDLNYLSARMLKIERQQAPKLGDWDVQPHLSTLTTEILKIKDRLDTLEESRKRIEDLSARMMELEQHLGRDRGDFMVEIRDLIKSGGALADRVDALETRVRRLDNVFCNCPANKFPDFDRRIKECEERTMAYPARNTWQLDLEKHDRDIGALTLRLDNAESAIQRIQDAKKD